MARRLFPLLLLCASCGEGLVEVQGEGELLATETSALGTPAGAVRFESGWKMSSTPLYWGGEVAVSVDPSRFPRCGVDGKVTAFLAPDGRDPVAEVVLTRPTGSTGPVTGTYQAPTYLNQGWGYRELQVWVKSESGADCLEWDSNFGANYRFPIGAHRGATVRFGADWSVQADGPVHKGGLLVVDYDIARLPSCRTIYRGFASWSIDASARFDTGEERMVRVVEHAGSDVAHLVVLDVPANANRVELWFVNSYYPVCMPAPGTQTSGWWDQFQHPVDSDYGRNFSFAVE